MTTQAVSRSVVPYLREFDDQEKALIDALLAQVAPKASPGEKALFLYTAQKKGLDPFDKQIYLVPRWDNEAHAYKHAVQISIDALRLMAQRSGKYAGQTPYQWCGSDGKWVDVWLSDAQPMAARVGILRHDFKEPLYSVALFNSYKQTKKDGSLNTFWNKYGAHMIAKCAEALSIRRGFPEETSGFYIPEEMGNPELTYVAEVEQDNTAPVAESEVVDEPPITEQQLTSIRKLCEHLGKPEPDTSGLSYQAAKDLIATLSQEYRVSRSKQAPAPVQPAQDEATESVDTLTIAPVPSALRTRCNLIHKDYDALVRTVKKSVVPDDELSMADRQAMHKLVVGWEAYAEKEAAKKTA